MNNDIASQLLKETIEIAFEDKCMMKSSGFSYQLISNILNILVSFIEFVNEMLPLEIISYLEEIFGKRLNDNNK